MQSVFRSVARFQPQRILTLGTPTTSHSAFSSGRSTFGSLPSFDNRRGPNGGAATIARPFFHSASWRQMEAAAPVEQQEASRARSRSPERRAAQQQRRARTPSPERGITESQHLVVFPAAGIFVDESFVSYVKGVCEKNGLTLVAVRKDHSRVFVDFKNAEDAETAKGALIAVRQDGLVRGAWFSAGPVVKPPNLALEPTRHLFIGNIEKDVTLQDVIDSCADLEGVRDVRFITPMTGNKAFIDFATVEQATAAREKIDGSPIPRSRPESKVLCTYTNPPRETRSEVPSAPKHRHQPPTDRIFITYSGDLAEADKLELTATFKQFPGFVGFFFPAEKSPTDLWAMAYFHSIPDASAALRQLNQSKDTLKELELGEDASPSKFRFQFARRARTTAGTPPMPNTAAA